MFLKGFYHSTIWHRKRSACLWSMLLQAQPISWVRGMLHSTVSFMFVLGRVDVIQHIHYCALWKIHYMWLVEQQQQHAHCNLLWNSGFLYLHSISILLLNAFTVFLSNSSSYCSLLLSRKSEESSKKSDSASSDSDLPPEYLNSPLSRETQVSIYNNWFVSPRKH